MQAPVDGRTDLATLHEFRKHQAATEHRDTTRSSSETSVTDEPVVEVSNLKIQYGDKVILENFNWRVNKGGTMGPGWKKWRW